MSGDREWTPDLASHVYVYLQVAQHIAEQIDSGHLPVGARLAAERDIAEQYGVAVNTIRRAVRELRERGLVLTVPIKGTFVMPARQSAEGAEDPGAS